MDRLKIFQVNIQSWNTNKFNIFNSIRNHDYDIILLNEHGARNNEVVQIFGYNTYKVNISDSRNDGSILAIKKNIKHKRIECLSEITLATKTNKTVLR